MSAWIVTSLNVIIILLTLFGMLMFPLVPMFFGVYESTRGTVKARIVVILLFIFPVVSLPSAFFAWGYNGWLCLLPIAYLFIVWMVRPSKQ